MQQLLRIRWPYGVEYIAFDEDDVPPEMGTSELWRDGTKATYVAGSDFTSRGRNRELRLQYDRDRQTDEAVIDPTNGARFGVATITWRSGESIGKAVWQDNDDKSWDGTTDKVDVLGGQPFRTNERAKKSVLVVPRRKQAAFRDALRQIDKRCVLSGESCPEALQAAHILPVAKNGHEQIENGILLRADLHLLFDAGLIWLEVTDEEAVVCWSDNLTSDYVKSLRNKKLPNETFKRVKKALQKRSRLPGGQGRDPA